MLALSLQNHYNIGLNQILSFGWPSYIFLYYLMLEILPRAHHKHPMPAESSCSSADTSSSSSPKSLPVFNPEDYKEKSQLCRSFMQLGFCPYQKRCKFAHGSHQLLKNNQINVKYKTKECQNYRRNLCCLYGNRCNFIHARSNPLEPTPEARCDVVLRLVKRSTCENSRLLSLLERPQV